MWMFPLIAAMFIWSDADHDLLEPPWQWGRLIAVALCVVVATAIYLVRGDDA